MLRPSYTELMSALNAQNNQDEQITSRYAVVVAVSKRARQIIDGDEPRASAPTDKAVSVAVSEMNLGLVSTYPDAQDAPAVNKTVSMGFSSLGYSRFDQSPQNTAEDDEGQMDFDEGEEGFEEFEQNEGFEDDFNDPAIDEIENFEDDYADVYDMGDDDDFDI